jgi:hypothetical protein
MVDHPGWWHLMIASKNGNDAAWELLGVDRDLVDPRAGGFSSVDLDDLDLVSVDLLPWSRSLGPTGAHGTALEAHSA